MVVVEAGLMQTIESHLKRPACLLLLCNLKLPRYNHGETFGNYRNKAHEQFETN